MSDPRTHLPLEAERGAAPDMLAELGPLAYGLFVLAQGETLDQIRTLEESRVAQVPAQADHSSDRDTRSEALLDELGELDL